jgi:hypothetical protein
MAALQYNFEIDSGVYTRKTFADTVAGINIDFTGATIEVLFYNVYGDLQTTPTVSISTINFFIDFLAASTYQDGNYVINYTPAGGDKKRFLKGFITIHKGTQ